MPTTQLNQNDDTYLLARHAAIGAGDLRLAVRRELTQLLSASGGDRAKALIAGLEVLVDRDALTAAEAKQLSVLFGDLNAGTTSD